MFTTYEVKRGQTHWAFYPSKDAARVCQDLSGEGVKGVRMLEVEVEESPGQSGHYRLSVSGER